MAKQRVDALLVSRGLCDSREQAKRLIMAGEVMTGTERVAKPSTKIACFKKVQRVSMLLMWGPINWYGSYEVMNVFFLRSV